jgi:hypothetical protein
MQMGHGLRHGARPGAYLRDSLAILGQCNIVPMGETNTTARERHDMLKSTVE